MQVGSLIALLAEPGEDWKNVICTETPKITNDAKNNPAISNSVVASSEHLEERNSKRAMCEFALKILLNI